VLGSVEEKFELEYRLRFRLDASLGKVETLDAKFSRVEFDRARALPDIVSSLEPLQQVARGVCVCACVRVCDRVCNSGTRRHR
jgi:hypothetical protein